MKMRGLVLRYSFEEQGGDSEPCSKRTYIG